RELACSSRKSLTKRKSLAFISFVRDELNTIIGKILYKSSGPVTTSVIYNYDFAVGADLAELFLDLCNTITDMISLVVGRHDDGYSAFYEAVSQFEPTRLRGRCP